MTKEIRISIAILILGAISLGIYWFIPVGGSQAIATEKNIKERIFLAQYEAEVYQNIPEVKSYLKDLNIIIQSGKSILPLSNSELDKNGIKVQHLLLTDTGFIEDGKQGDKLLHNDMMRILPSIVSTLDSSTAQICKTTTCYTAEKYNFVTNATTRATVDVDNNKVLKVQRFPNMQPDISLRLKRMAQAIALNAPEVKKELGKTPAKKDMSMANVRSALKESPCEQSAHLCVAPTFADHEKEQVLWAIIDLTELKLSAAKWAGLGKTTTPACISERTLQNKFIMENYCRQDSYLDRNGWKMTYRLTGSDGLEIRDVSFNGEPVLTSAKTVDWHVSYQQKGADQLDTSGETYIAGRRVEYIVGEDNKYQFGYNDAMGCPMFSTSVVLPFNGPLIKPLKGQSGFALTQDFRNPKWPMACNYRYENRFEFYDDGSFRILAINKGRGCGINAIYRPIMRIDMAVSDEQVFSSYDNQWSVWEKENSSTAMPKNIQYPFKVTEKNTNKGYYIEPNHGQFSDQSRGDHATIYATKFNPEEGDQDLLTLGSCCDLKDDGVYRYLENKENINGENIVLWYVPRVKNDATEGSEYCWADTVLGDDGNLEVKEWPCSVGPKFVPIGLEGQ